MSEGTFRDEPIIGHHVSAELYEHESMLTKQLDGLAENLDVPRRSRDRIRFEVGDVDWDETKTLSMKTETFEKLIEWYENTDNHSNQ